MSMTSSTSVITSRWSETELKQKCIGPGRAVCRGAACESRVVGSGQTALSARRHHHGDEGWWLLAAPFRAPSRGHGEMCPQENKDPWELVVSAQSVWSTPALIGPN